MPGILLAKAWYWDDAAGKPNPGPARLEIWRKSADGEWEPVERQVELPFAEDGASPSG